MSNDALDDFERLFDLPNQIQNLNRTVASLQTAISAANPASVSTAIGSAFQSSAKDYFGPVLRALEGVDRAASKLDAIRMLMSVRRKILVVALAIALALAIFVAGAAFGRSPAITAAALQTRPGCDYFGGQWVSDKRVQACAFRTN